MIPSLDDVKFSRKRKGLKKKTFTSTKNYGLNQVCHEIFLAPFVEKLITICDMQMKFLNFLFQGILFDQQRTKQKISISGKCEILITCEHAIVVHGRLSSHMWCMQMTIFLILSWNTIIQKFYVVKLIQKICLVSFFYWVIINEKEKKQLFYSTTLWA